MERKEPQIDSQLLFILFGLFIFSLVVVYSASGQYQVDDPFYYVKRQVVWYIIGFIAMTVVMHFDYELLEKWALPLYAVGLGLLLLVHFFGTLKNGSQRWISFGFFELQPSEFMKLFLVLLLAYYLSRVGEKSLTFMQSIPITLKLLSFTIVPFFLILIQPDLGSALVIAAVLFTLIGVSAISYKIMLLLLSGFAALITCLVYLHNHFFDIFIKIIKPHQLERIYGWLSLENFSSSYGYQLTQSMLGIGSGQITGSGFNQGSQVQSGRIPEVHTDFIFAVIGEEFGFVGASILICLYLLLIFRMVHIALRANTLFAVYIIAGIIGLIAFQVFQNISMTIGLMPITGLALPFISYGGSALLTNMIGLGLVLSVHKRSKHYMFSKK
ncbi:rod shape-determining protein RodA [Robertmurraya sp. DFI.2.37]|uniref:rod shape-determining protein RodA n=1 Tax=Robertmurraya sp. DFI.2.37 TaxID=3031819 RepID=UPI001248FD0D|nr:rod shape-determining protein RodA [Robertmurraya sp. DFI.2.37]MDF1508967.1 rod shape-determining protein RodA [Robertmurraya sp. DFI.2.37]